MRHAVIDLTTSTSTSLNEKNAKEFNADVHFRWDSIKKFVYLAYVFSCSNTNFDVFSKVLSERARFLDFIFQEVSLGMSYMFMDFFILQYTRRFDCNQALSPLLRGITAGTLLQTSVWTLIHATDLADAIRFIIGGFQESPAWSRCQKRDRNTTCFPSRDIMWYCQMNAHSVNMNITSAHLNYVKSFRSLDRAILTSRFFPVGIVWLCTFFIATIQDTSMLKLFKLAFLWKLLSTLVLLLFVVFTRDASVAVLHIFDVADYATKPYPAAAERVAHAFGIGFIGIYDFGSISPYMMIDNAIVMFTCIFTVLAFATSLIVQTLYLSIAECVKIEIAVTNHYLLFAVLPLTTEFMDVHKIYALYIYLSLTTATSAYLAMLTLSISRLLHSEFRSVKNVYVIGMLCFLGFGLSFPITVLKGSNRMMGLARGLNLTALYLGGAKAAVVMWGYGVERFSTDVHFWLGFRPTKFWRISWTLLPALLLLDVVIRAKKLISLNDMQQKMTAIIWISFITLTVLVFHVRTIARYVLQNNPAAAFRSAARYGPPEPEDRKRRRSFDVTLNYRKCKHDCLVLDEKFECNHLPLIFKKKERVSASSSDSSLTHIYEAGTSSKIHQSVPEFTDKYD